MSAPTVPVVAVVQARMSSTRLPGKVLAELAGKPLIVFMIERLKRAKSLNGIIVATSVDPSDDRLVEALDHAGIPSVRGDLHDVLLRYVAAAEVTGANVIVRATGDCPLIDPEVVDGVVDLLLEGHQYCSNVDPRTFPDGLDVEAFTLESLSSAKRSATRAEEREHVTPWMRSAEAALDKANYADPFDLADIRWTVDYEKDLAMVRSLVDAVADPIAADRFDFLRAMTKMRGAR